MSTPHFAAKNKVPQENIPANVRDKVRKTMMTEFAELVGCDFEDLDGAKVKTHLQLWGAGQPANIYKAPCFLDPIAKVGVCGDWMVAPSVEGAALSGLSLADAIAKSMDAKDSDRLGIGIHIGTTIPTSRVNSSAKAAVEPTFTSTAGLEIMIDDKENLQDDPATSKEPLLSSPLGAFGSEWLPSLLRAEFFEDWQSRDAVAQAHSTLERLSCSEKKNRRHKTRGPPLRGNGRSGRGDRRGGRRDKSKAANERKTMNGDQAKTARPKNPRDTRRTANSDWQ
uniref:Uncharacterized protein n=1 Tax=Norrisiella sphaerica TaxID=552664 RepID=A0A7S2VUC4_9EUKA|mmetsp:Transcript_2176/g.3079  ORF Transcript_2176/g.3079 Transcript_2176/m.3079 type:complete len:281 (+) Transcript_2176:3-845(+)